jgi:hypothetical protein
MEALHAVLSARRDEVVFRWLTMVRDVAPATADSASNVELTDQLSEFLNEVIAALRADAGLNSIPPPPARTRNVPEQSPPQFRHGFNLEAVVQEYGALRDAIIVTARDGGAEISLRELQIIFSAILRGVARATSEYVRQREAELERDRKEQRSFIAQGLSNALSSAIAAFKTLKQRVQLPTDGGAALETSLQRMQQLIDERLNAGQEVTAVSPASPSDRKSSAVRP